MGRLLKLEHFKAIFPKAPVEFCDEIDKWLIPFGITSVFGVAAFMAQAGNESGAFTGFEEFMNYSSAGLMRQFPDGFPSDQPEKAKQYAAAGPKAIANYVYGPDYPTAKRKGLGNTIPGDPWRFRGCGIFQITGRAIYGKCNDLLGSSKFNTVEEFADYAKTFQGIVLSAFLYWKLKKLGKYIANFDEMNKVVNPDCKENSIKNALYASWISVLNGGPVTYSMSRDWIRKPANSPASIYNTANYLPNGGAKNSGGVNDINIPAEVKNSEEVVRPHPSNTNNNPSAPVVPLNTAIARDSNVLKGGNFKHKFRVVLSRSFLRDQFQCPCGCGWSTVDTNLIVALQKLQDAIGDDKPITVLVGTICDKQRKRALCDQAFHHIIGRAADIKVKDASAPYIVKKLESLFGNKVFCYAVDNEVVHLDSGNW